MARRLYLGSGRTLSTAARLNERFAGWGLETDRR